MLRNEFAILVQMLLVSSCKNCLAGFILPDIRPVSVSDG